MSENVIEARNIVVRFSLRKGLLKRIYFNAVDNVTLEIRKGDIVGLVGESGSGKTTLGKVTLDLLKPYRGDVLFQGKSIYNMTREEYRKYRVNAQYIPQDPYASINMFRKVGEALLDIVRYHKLASTEKEAIDLVKDIMIRVGLNPPEKYMNKYPIQLSGGERQRLSIARALVLRPAYVVADEPTTMLDASLKAGIIKTLRDMVRALGLSLLFITHELTLLQFFGPKARVAIMYLGKIVEEGFIKDVLTEPLHPYTRALLLAIPVPDPRERHTRKLILKGSIPSPINKPSGCVLSDRCPYVTDICKKEEPELKEVSPGRKVACHLYD